MKDLEKVREYAEKEEERYNDLAFKCIEKNNVAGASFHTAEASGFGRVRMFIDTLTEQKAQKPLTQYDRIKAMSVEEMASVYYKYNACNCTQFNKCRDCFKCWVVYLNSKI